MYQVLKTSLVGITLEAGEVVNNDNNVLINPSVTYTTSVPNFSTSVIWNTKNDVKNWQANSLNNEVFNYSYKKIQTISYKDILVPITYLYHFDRYSVRIMSISGNNIHPPMSKTQYTHMSKKIAYRYLQITYRNNFNEVVSEVFTTIVSSILYGNRTNLLNTGFVYTINFGQNQKLKYAFNYKWNSLIHIHWHRVNPWFLTDVGRISRLHTWTIKIKNPKFQIFETKKMSYKLIK